MSVFSKKLAMSLVAIAGAASLAVVSAPAFAGPPGGPGGPGGGPGMRGGGPGPGGGHHYRWYRDPGIWAPALITGAIIGGVALSQRDRVVERVVEVPVAPAQAAGSYTWYWCSSEQGYYPSVQSCPLGWQPVMGASPSTPPAPPR
ncbi:hypothetical protein [Sutterella sp.]|uniref:hypothetical protein n=1 Tax=Sutterella sp. TaxID=1981025 RepID=UPI0026E07B6E|nr:hypothetical protein [Sutterella sp.]MDO5531784.1 hypothetical protein [Sutterella sp.]